MYENMMSSKGVRTRHHIRRFLRRYLVLKIYQNTGQTPGTMAKANMANMSNDEGRAVLTVDNFNSFYFCIDSP